MEENNALVPVVDNHMAKLTITYNGEQGDLPDPVSYDATDADLKQMATESVRQGYVPGISAAGGADFTDFVVDRFPARQDVPFNRLSLRPKTPFGGEKRIWKFPIGPNSLKNSTFKMEVPMPEGAVIRYLGLDPQGNACIWAEVDLSKEKKVRKFHSIGTGHGVVPENCTFIGTVVLQGFVFHLYEPAQG